MIIYLYALNSSWCVLGDENAIKAVFQYCVPNLDKIPLHLCWVIFKRLKSYRNALE